MFGRHRHCDHEGRRGGETHFGRHFARGRDDYDDRHVGGHHRHGGGRRGRRFFDHGDLRLVVLKLIGEKPRYGYDLIKAIEEEAGGQYSPSPGVVYPTLTLLEELGYIEVGATEGPKKLYAITESGQDFLAVNKGTLDTIVARMADARAMHGDGPPDQIIRAMENLKTALRLRLSRGRPANDEIRAMAAAIDAAAQAVEQCRVTRTEAMLTAQALVETASARRYMGQLCKHFAHKLPVELNETDGRIEFAMGTCSASAEEGHLRLTAQAADEESLTTLKDIIDRHLVRFAFRETLVITWAPVA